MALSQEQELIEKLRDRENKLSEKATAYEISFKHLKSTIGNIMEGVHWALRFGVLGCSFWFLGWRFSAGVLAFILADESIRWAKREIEEVGPLQFETDK